MYAQKQAYMQESRLGLFLRIRNFVWRQQLLQRWGAMPVRRSDELPLWLDDCWDAEREQVRPQPIEGLREQIAMQGGASQRLLFNSFLL
jgi:hypothetical protein